MILAIAGAVLLAIGLFALVMSSDYKKSGPDFYKYIFVSLILVIAGGWLLLTTITIGTIIRKVAGIFLALLGIFLIAKFPGGYIQHDFYRHAAIFVGFISVILGIYLLLF